MWVYISIDSFFQCDMLNIDNVFGTCIQKKGATGFKTAVHVMLALVQKELKERLAKHRQTIADGQNETAQPSVACDQSATVSYKGEAMKCY